MAKLSTSYFYGKDRIGSIGLFWLGFFFFFSLFSSSEESNILEDVEIEDGEVLEVLGLFTKSVKSKHTEYMNFSHVIRLYSDVIGQMEYFFQLFLKAVAHVFRDKEWSGMNIAFFFFSWGLLAKPEKFRKLFALSKRH